MMRRPIYVNVCAVYSTTNLLPILNVEVSGSNFSVVERKFSNRFLFLSQRNYKFGSQLFEFTKSKKKRGMFSLYLSTESKT